MTELCCKCNLPKESPKAHYGSASFRYICRLCLMRAEEAEPIFIHPGDRTLANKIFACTGVEIDEKAAVGPSAICISCKTSVYKSYQFLELCQRNNKIIQNLLANHDTYNSTQQNELRMVIRPGQTAANQHKSKSRRKRTLSRRKSTRSNMQSSTSTSDITWSDCEDDENECHAFDEDEIIPYRQLAYETDTQEESPKRRRLNEAENKVPALVIPLARLNGFTGTLQSERRISRHSIIDQTGENDLFQCEFCDGSFPYRIQIKQHIDLYHANRKHELACKFCSKTYFTTETLRRHIAEKHASTILRECKLCDRSFTTAQGLHQHYRTIMHRAATGEAVYPRRRYSYQSNSSRRNSVCSNFSENDYQISERRSSQKSQSSRMNQDDNNPYADVCYDEVTTYKCDYCDAYFDDEKTLAKHTAVQPCRIELEPLDLDLLLEKMDLDELLQPLNNIDDVAIIEPPIEIVDLT
ncbi:GDNF-inducible zinc finger protein 1-like [Wyeomyia smithii]|uniref:GDNF-inducible zinc finger protein 1-like n=1 Tax=Wyeomyia smithii TaxID=174621 RepID=UPI002467E1AC|nr:GDNF-inducible zinc finger protein 1-like [Wyeomyia smithii]